MDARYFFVWSFGLLCANSTWAVEGPQGNMRTRNFIVSAPDQQLASQIGFAAEKYRRDLAMEWLGKEIPDWPQPCVITAAINSQAFGETSFSFAGRRGQKTRPFDFVMKVNGSRERILDSVLPHEVSHTIFATHFGQPLPRWADEGACTTVEHISERRKNHQMLIEFLTTDRGIPFNQMFAMKNYPRDILPLYAQGYSVCRFLIQRGGKRKFIRFMDDGLAKSDWNGAVARNYQIKDLSQLQVQWLEWVKTGCPAPQSSQTRLVSTPVSKQADQTRRVPQSSNFASLPKGDSVEPSQSKEIAAESQNDADVLNLSENFYFREISRAKSGTLLR